MKISPLMSLSLLLFFSYGLAQDIPQANFSNGLIKARTYLPDVEKGYYRATRFDWSGIISNLEYDGHTYFGKWFKNYDPKVHESVMGPVEEFSPIGYDEVAVGENFIKIGVGALIKPKEPKYFLFNSYEIENSGKWEISKSANQVEYNHILDDINYSYEYKKVISLTEGKPEMVLHHTLKNTGDKIIETEVYDHNFFMIDNERIGPGYVIKFPFKITGEGDGIGEFAEIDNQQIKFTKNLGERDHVYIKSITGYESKASDYDIRVENKNTGAGVRITCDRPLSKLVFWSATKTVCPEPYILIKVKPGETFTWKITYNYYTL